MCEGRAAVSSCNILRSSGKLMDDCGGLTSSRLVEGLFCNCDFVDVTLVNIEFFLPGAVAFHTYEVGDVTVMMEDEDILIFSRLVQ